ncbi:hypothetical protein FOA52_015869 [Chlamydomonas sp. UWO 241]|nr:hypothetical protein FOA52_015869 [Chlamydomonas sp. UWO 241]
MVWGARPHLAVRHATDLVPLATASLAGLTSLTVRQADPGEVLDVPTFSNSVAATLQLIDISGCGGLHSSDFVRSCVQLRCLWMPGFVSASDLSPLAACSETLEELWMAENAAVASLAPLKVCHRLRKLDLRDCHYALRDHVEDLRPAGGPGISRDRRPGARAPPKHSIPPNIQDKAAITAAGAIPALVLLLGPDSAEAVKVTAAGTLRNLAANHAQNRVAVTAAGAVPALVLLLGRHSRTDVQ